MHSIWKYSLALGTEDQGVLIPEGAQFRACAMQYGTVRLWFEVDPSRAGDVRVFRVFATGEPTIDPVGTEYLGTVLMAGESLVWHIYEVLPAPR